MPFDSIGNLKKHYQAKHEKLKIKCELCGKELGLLSIKQHKKVIHDLEKAFSCKICEKDFTNISNLKVHHTVHHELKKLECQFCSFETKYKNEMKKHITMRHSIAKDGLLKCEHCDKHFYEPNLLRSHINRKHLELFAFKCDRCEKAYKFNSSLQSHVRNVHETAEYIAKCSVCNQKFASESRLKYHKTYKH